MSEVTGQGSPEPALEIAPNPRGATFGALAQFIQTASTGDRAALARLQPESLQPHELAALARAMLAAGLQPERWQPQTWQRWALIARGMAMAGHSGHSRLGRQFADAGVSESRVSKLLTSRGDAFKQLLPRILRLMASKGVAPNWFELGELVLKEASPTPLDQERAEALRLLIAGPYFSAIAQAAKA